MVRVLPYPELLLAELSGRTLEEIGPSLICQGWQIMIDKYRETTTSASIATLLLEWRTVLISALEMVHKWPLAHNKEQWARVHAGPRTPLVGRTLPGVDDSDYCRFVASAFALTRYLPGELAQLDVANQNAALLVWLSQPSNLSGVQEAISEQRRGD